MRSIKLLTGLCLLFSFTLTYAQGIKFDESLSWNQIKNKAKEEHKYIFLDCFATWCGPCKIMDADIYLKTDVGNEVNSKFISVKVQFDQTAKDNDYVKLWYEDAKRLNDQFKLEGYPSFLFFNSNGELIHRGIGQQNKDDFIAMIKFALAPERVTYYADLEAYKLGIKDYSQLYSLIITTRDLVKNKELAASIAKDYKQNYLDKLPQDQLCTKEIMQFVRNYPNLIHTSDNLFKLFYNSPAKISKIDSDLASQMVDYIIYMDEIHDKLWKDDKPIFKNPDWNNINLNISRKYGKQYNKLIPPAKVIYYRQINSWRQWAKAKNEEITIASKSSQEHSTEDAWPLNLAAWDAAKNCTDKSVLEIALNWINLSIKLSSSLPEGTSDQFLDTKACLLYKLGRISNAIECESEAMKISGKLAKLKGRETGPYSAIYRDRIVKMQNREGFEADESIIKPIY